MEKNKGFLELKTAGNLLVIKDKNYAGAREKYDEALPKAKNNKEIAMIHYNKGITYESEESYTDALAHYRDAILKDPDYFKAMTHMAKIHVKLEDYKSAREMLLQMYVYLKKNGLSVDKPISDIWNKVNAATSKPRAIEFLKKIENDNEPIRPLTYVIEQYLTLFFVDPVSLLWKKRLAIEKASGPGVLTGYAAAVRALQDREYDKVIGYCDEELENNDECVEENAGAYLLRGTFRFLWGYGTKSLEDFQKVLNSKDRNITDKMRSCAAVKCALYYARWTELPPTKDIPNITFDHFNIASNLWENSDCYFHRGFLFLADIKDFDEAKSQFEKALKCCPKRESNIFYQCAVYFATFFSSTSREEWVYTGKEHALPALLKLEPKFDVDYCYEMLDMILICPFPFNDCPLDVRMEMTEKIAAMQSKNPLKMVKRLMNELGTERSKSDEFVKELWQLKEKYGDFADIYHTITAVEFSKGPSRGNWKLAFEYTFKAMNMYRTFIEVNMVVPSLQEKEFQYDVWKMLLNKD